MLTLRFGVTRRSTSACRRCVPRNSKSNHRPRCLARAGVTLGVPGVARRARSCSSITGCCTELESTAQSSPGKTLCFALCFRCLSHLCHCVRLVFPLPLWLIQRLSLRTLQAYLDRGVPPHVDAHTGGLAVIGRPGGVACQRGTAIAPLRSPGTQSQHTRSYKTPS